MSILDYQSVHGLTEPVRRSENHSLQPGTNGDPLAEAIELTRPSNCPTSVDR